MTPTLDRNRDFGEIHGEAPFAAKYDQDGFLFCAQGELIHEALDEKGLARLESIKNQNEAQSAARAAFKKIMPSASEEQLAKLINLENLKPADPNAAEIDLAKWARGEQTVLFGRVAKKIREEYDQSPVNKKQALEILAEHGVIAPIAGASTIPSQT
jgi:hypothetical protein